MNGTNTQAWAGPLPGGRVAGDVRKRGQRTGGGLHGVVGWSGGLQAGHDGGEVGWRQDQVMDQGKSVTGQPMSRHRDYEELGTE